MEEEKRTMSGRDSMTKSNCLSRRELIRRAAALGVSLPFSGLILAACADDRPDPATDAEGPLADAVYMTPFGFIPSFFVMYVADRQGYWREEGLNVVIRGGQGTATAVQGVAGGSADLSTVSSLNSIPAIANEEFPLVNVGQYNQETLFSVVSRADEPIQSPEDMLGKTVGIWSAGGAAEMIAQIVVSTVGNIEDMGTEIVGGGPAGLPFLEKGDIDVWIAEEPDVRWLEEQGADLYSFSPDEFAPVPDMAFLVPRTLSEENPETVEKLLRGAHRAMEFSLDEGNVDAVVESIAEVNPDVDAEQVRFQVPILAQKLTAGGDKPLLTLDESAWETGQQLMVDAGLVKGAVPVNDLIDTGFATRVVE